MSKVENYRRRLRGMMSWESFLLRESNLPGPRANLELAFAFASEADEAACLRYAALDVTKAPPNTKQEFLAFCGVLGLGYQLALGHDEHIPAIRRHACDPRWRIREAVVHGLQQYGRADMSDLFRLAKSWSQGNLLERRAAVAGLCEPSILSNTEHAEEVIGILDSVTSSVIDEKDRRCDDFKTLRKTLGYCWSVAVAALPEPGMNRMEAWIGTKDKDVRWIMKQNLKRNRLIRLAPEWVRARTDDLGW